MLKPVAWEPVTVKLGTAVGGYVGQMLITFPFTVPPAEPLSLMLPFDQTSPVMAVVEVPVNTRDGLPDAQLPGLSVCRAAPFCPGGRATAVAVAPTPMVDPNPRTCIIAIPTRWVAVAWKETPAIE